MQKIIKNILLLFIFIIGINAFAWRTEAAGETTQFGSESYQWQIDTPAQIGVYVNSEQMIETAEMYVVYDPEMLEFVSGGELVESGRIKITGGDRTSNQAGAILEMIPRMSGNTGVHIQSANIRTIDGQNVEVAGTSAGIHIPLAEGCALKEIQVNGISVEGFDPNVTNYTLEVENKTENAEIFSQPMDANAQVEISDSHLNVGINYIRVIVTNTFGQKARYELNISRQEDLNVETNLNPTEKNKPEKLTEEHSSVITGKKKNFVIFAVVLLIVGGFCAYWKNRPKMQGKIHSKKKKDAQRSGQQLHESENENLEESYTWDGENLEEAEDFANLEDFDYIDDREVEILVKNVTMEFKRVQDEETSIKELLIKVAKRQRKIEKFKALDNISFNVKKGEVVGIIGTNGSGKSTMLKIISGALTPTRGIVEVDKKKIQLLTLGTGFDFELTGRENVYLNGAIIGYTKEFIDEKYDDIVEFAELEGFMDEKVRNYSSGMVSRFGFAIATIRETPEILILDEVLSVGDMFFRQKSNARIREMIRSGSTVLIVSHSTSVICANCTKAIWIEKGILKAVGEPSDVCKAYEKMNR